MEAKKRTRCSRTESLRAYLLIIARKGNPKIPQLARPISYVYGRREEVYNEVKNQVDQSLEVHWTKLTLRIQRSVNR